MKVIAKIYTDFPTKFGIPRQSCLIPELTGTIVMEKEYRQIEAFRGIEEFSHLWLLWEFSEAKRQNWSATVKPPRLGGKTRMGVFATRSPFRPNPIGLSVVKLLSVELHETFGTILHVGGIDCMDQTPIYDIKPYLPYVDAIMDAKGGFGDRVKEHRLHVDDPQSWLEALPENKRAGAAAFLAQDPRPAVHGDEERIYKIAYAGYDIHFTVKEEVLTIKNVISLAELTKYNNFSKKGLHFGGNQI